MYVIVTYDIHRKRVAKVMKICRKYLCGVHRSVFEGKLTEAEFLRFKRDIATAIDPHYDSVVVYQLQSMKYTRKESIGLESAAGNII